MKNSIGVSTNCECGDTMEETLQYIKAAGFDSVMLSFKKGQVERQIEATIGFGLKISYVHLPYAGDANASSLWSKGETHDIFVNQTIELLEICGKYNIPIAVMHPTWGSASNLALPPTEQGIMGMKKILEAAKKNNVKVAVENVDSPNAKNLFYLLDHLPELGFCYDCGHHQLYNPEEPLLQKYGSRVLAVHLHDNLMDWEYGWDFSRDLHMLPFDGKINFNTVMKNLAETSYDNTILLELHRDQGASKLYAHLSPQDYLKEGYQRGIRLAKLFNDFRNKK